MARIPPSLDFRRDARVLKKLPPYLSALCVLVGVAWLLLLPLDGYSRKTYISENALLPGQVHTYFGGSEHNIFRAYRHEVAELEQVPAEERVKRLGDILRSFGLKVATQDYHYESAGRVTAGTNVYAVLQSPRADATEAVVLIGAWRNMDGAINYSGVALVLTLARYFKRWSLWSKDIIFLISGDSAAGPTAWVDAYHDAQPGEANAAAAVQPLALKSGALQGAIAVDYPAGPWGHRFDKLHVVYDGVNGQLPNLDLINTAVQVAGNQVGIGSAFQRMWEHGDGYSERLRTMLRGMLGQALGCATGPHSSFIPYHVDAITLQTVGDGWHDEMSLGRVVESMFRSLNNLLEHLHQSFFFYLLMHTQRFVSIGTYLPSAMIVAASFSIMSVALWVQSGRPSEVSDTAASKPTKGSLKGETTVLSPAGTSVATSTAERHMFLPLVFVSIVQFLGLLPLYVFNHSSESLLQPTFVTFAVLSTLAPHLAAFLLTRFQRPSSQEFALIQCFSLLLLGMFLSALATLNFSLSFHIGLLAAPLSFVRHPSTTPAAPTTQKTHLATAAAQILLLQAVSPVVVVVAASAAWGGSVVDVLVQAAFGWHVWGMWTQVVVWLVWWPAWFAGMVLVSSSVF